MMTRAALMSLLLVGALAHDESDWTYSGGPLDQDHWPEEYPACGGERQSPINVQTEKVQYNPALKALNLTGYDAQGLDFPIMNTGHRVMISLPPTMRMTVADGTEYIARQMHFHWGGGLFDVGGSEHTIDGIRYAAEIHVVHYNSKYSSYEDALRAPDGVATLAGRVEVKEYMENTYYSNLLSGLKNVKHPGQSTVLSDLNIRDMLPQNLNHYYTYPGSFSTPPCRENVQWFVLEDTVPLSTAQIAELENSVLDNQNKVLQDNHRRTQPLNGRVVEASFICQPDPGSELQYCLSEINRNLKDLRSYVEDKKA